MLSVKLRVQLSWPSMSFGRQMLKNLRLGAVTSREAEDIQCGKPWSLQCGARAQ
jgi:hypothetical protein